MKHVFLIIFTPILFLIVIADVVGNNQEPQDQKLRNANAAINQVIDKVVKTLCAKYGAHPNAVAIGAPNWVVKELGLGFDIHGPLPKYKIRKMLVDSAQLFIRTLSLTKKSSCYTR